MVLAKSKNNVGLGNSLMNDRFGKGKGQDMRRGPQGIKRTAPDGTTYVTTPKAEAAWVKMQSITEQGDLDEFLSTAQLAGTDFTAEKVNNVKIIHTDQKNPYLLSAAEERATIRKQKANRDRLRVPRRPPWDEHTTPHELDQMERMNMLQWRRGLAELQENHDLLMTPFERNIEVWRQLWRVIERSDLVVQIVDARNPLLFRCEDLEAYVKEVDKKKKNLLLINKADMMTTEQRQIWADYFKQAGIRFAFFSAAIAKDLNDALEESDDEQEDDEQEDDEQEDDEQEDDEQENEDEEDSPDSKLVEKTEKLTVRQDEADKDEDDEDEDEDADEDDEDWTSEEEVEGEDVTDESQADPTRILTTEELEELFLRHAPRNNSHEPSGKTQVGLVGYPNVGKSSTINALIGAKKVSVSATPGKTKHFQTIHLSDSVILCDCPGLVFPNFATTKAELVCNGVLPIDQLREFTGPAALVAMRIPQSFLEAVYGMKIRIRPLEEGGTGIPTGEEVLRAYATARGFATTGQGQPDESRAARYVLKDYVKGKLLFCHPPPLDPAIDDKEFNHDLYDFEHLPTRRQAVLNATSVGLDDASDIVPLRAGEGAKTRAMDKRFFGPGQGSNAHLARPFHQQAVGAQKQLSGRKQRTMIALEKDVDPSELRLNSKKHFKGNKRKGKVRGSTVD